MSQVNATEIKVDILGGPPGGYGFRSGYWPVTYRGVSRKVFCSVPHSCDFPEQVKRVQQAAVGARIFEES